MSGTPRRTRRVLLVVAVVAVLAVLVVWLTRPAAKPSGSQPTAGGTTIAPPPGSTGSGFPDAASTGARGALRAVDGELVLKQRGQVVSDLWVRGRITVAADDVVIRNVLVQNNDFWVVANYGHNLRLESSTLIGGPDTQAAVGDLNGGSFTGRALDVSGSADGLRMGSHSSLRDSFVHDLAIRDDLHNDAVELVGAREVSLVGNTILNENGQTSALSLGNYPAGQSAHVLISGNLLAGGGYAVYGGEPVQGVEFSDNRFSTRFFPRSGRFGVSAYWAERGNRWSDNRWMDGPNQGDLVQP